MDKTSSQSFIVGLVILLIITDLLSGGIADCCAESPDNDIPALKESMTKLIDYEPEDYETWLRERAAHYVSLLETSEKLLKTATQPTDIVFGQKGKLIALENLLQSTKEGFDEYGPQYRTYADELIRETPLSENALDAQALLLDLQYGDLIRWSMAQEKDIKTKEEYLRHLKKLNENWLVLEKALRDFVEKHPGVRANELLSTLAVGMCRFDVENDWEKLDAFKKFLEQSELEEAKGVLKRYDFIVQNDLTVKILQKIYHLLRLASDDEQTKDEVRPELRQWLDTQKEAILHNKDNDYEQTLESALEIFGSEDWILDNVREVQEFYRQSEDPKVQVRADWLDGTIRRNMLKGNEMEFIAYQLDGKKIDIRDFRGKVVLIDYWATWCGPCIASFPEVEKCYEKYREQGFEVIAYSVDHDWEILQAYEKKHPRSWISTSRQLTLDKGGKAYDKYYGINGIPHYILVGRDGKVVSAQTFPKGDEFFNMLEKALQER